MELVLMFTRTIMENNTGVTFFILNLPCIIVTQIFIDVEVIPCQMIWRVALPWHCDVWILIQVEALLLHLWS